MSISRSSQHYLPPPDPSQFRDNRRSLRMLEREDRLLSVIEKFAPFTETQVTAFNANELSCRLSSLMPNLDQSTPLFERAVEWMAFKDCAKSIRKLLDQKLNIPFGRQATMQLWLETRNIDTFWIYRALWTPAHFFNEGDFAADSVSIKKHHELEYVLFQNSPHKPAAQKEKFNDAPRQIKEYVYSKMVGNIWGISKTFFINSEECSVEGWDIMVSASVLKKYVMEYFSQRKKYSKEQMPGRFLRKVEQDMLRVCDSERTYAQVIENIRGGGVEVFLTGWERKHAVALVMNKNFYIYINRGDQSGAFPGLHTFSYNVNNVDESLISEIVFPRESMLNQAFFLEGLLKKLGAKKIAYFPMEYQKIGNCSWAGSKGAFLATLMLDKYSTSAYRYSSPDAFFNNPKGAFEVYKEFTRFVRTESLKEGRYFIQDKGILSELRKKALEKGINPYLPFSFGDTPSRRYIDIDESANIESHADSLLSKYADIQRKPRVRRAKIR